jgi:hypothetical protein
MYDDWTANTIVVVVTAMVVSVAVLLHYEGLSWLSARLAGLRRHRRRNVLYGIYGVIAIHIAEIWLFGLALWGLLALPGTGSLAGASPTGLLDAIYLSAVTFTTVGFGDLAPVGAIRFLSGTEAWTGFILITWSASFTYLEMERFWRGT